MTPSPDGGARPRTVYLDHAATTPMVPEAVEAMTAAARDRRQPLVPARLGAARPAAWSRRPARPSRRPSAPAPARSSSPAAAPSRTTWRSRACSGSAAARTPTVVGCSPARSSTTPCSTPCCGSPSTRARWSSGCPSTPPAGCTPRRSAAAIAADPGSVALVTVMWANNEVGTVQPVAELAAVAAGYGVPFHTDAVQAFGQLPVDFAAAGVDAMTVTGHKIGGPLGVGALLLGRSQDLVPLLHGGGQERDVRSGTLDTPAIVGLRGRRARSPSKRQSERAERMAGLRDDLVRRVREVVPDAVLNGDPDLSVDHRLPGNAHFSFPGCEGDALLLLLDARGIECSTGSACSAGVPQPSHVLLAMGVPEGLARGSLRFSFGHTSTAADVDAVVEAIGPVVERARAGRSTASRVTTPRIARPRDRAARDGLAAMSGGVDSAVAAARAVDAGHDVTGVHLALSSNPAVVPHRRPRLLHPRGRPRRPASGRRARHPVLRLGPRRAVPGRRGRRLRRRVRRRPHPQPLPALQREDQVLGGARQGARARLRRRLHRPLRPRRAGRPQLHRAVDPAKDQSYVLGVLDGPAGRARDVPARRHAQGARYAGRPAAAGWRSPTSRTATTSASSPTATPPGSCSAGSAPSPAPSSTATACSSASTTAPTRSPSGSGRACASATPAPDGKPRYVLDVSPVDRTVTVGPAEDLDVVAAGRRPAGVERPGSRRTHRLPRPGARPRRPGGRDRLVRGRPPRGRAGPTAAGGRAGPGRGAVRR